MSILRQCYKCKDTKPLDEFVRSRRNQCGYAYCCRPCAKHTARENYLGYYKVWRARTKYGLTIEEYNDLLSQGCQLCDSIEELCVDHSHTTGKVRGALCQICNRRLGHLEYSKEWTKKALEYLEWEL